MRMVQGSRCSERRRAILYVYLLMNVLISCLAGLAMLLFLASSPRQAYGGSGLSVDMSPTSAAIHAGSS
jgi:hypothetical protein